MTKALVPYDHAQAGATLSPHKVAYRVGNTKGTGKAQQLVKLFTGFDMANGHVRLEDAQRATFSEEYYALQLKLMKHIAKKYGKVMKSVASIEDVRAELQKMALDTDADVAKIIAEMTKLNEKHGLDLQQLQHNAQGEIGVMRAQTTAEINVANADFETRLRMITRGQSERIGKIKEGAQKQIQQQQQRQLEADQRARQSAIFNNAFNEAMNNPAAMPASRARGIFNNLGKMLKGI